MYDFPFNSPARIDAVLRENQGGIRKRWGQNFLTDPNHARKIVDCIREPGGTKVVEIGPGLGALTFRLLEAGLRVQALEIDPILADIVEEEYRGSEFASPSEPSHVNPAESNGERLRIHRGDARDLLKELPQSEVVCGNLPYYISTELIMAALALPRLRAGIFLTQLEFAERAAAQDASSSLSVYLGNFGQWRIAHRVPPGAFHPPPSVHSALLTFRADPSGPRVQGPLLEKYLRASFASRRKKISNSWKLARFPEQEYQALLQNAADLGLDPACRAEQWPRESYYDLTARMAGDGFRPEKPGTKPDKRG